MIGFGFSVFTLAIRQMLGFEPRSLFTAGEQGWVYDPSDFNRYMQPGQLSTATMFQDAAGTTPVTAMEQPLGLQLDVKNGVPVPGDELRGNGAVSTVGNPGTLATFNATTGEGSAYRLDGSNSSGVRVAATDGRTYLIDVQQLTGTLQIRGTNPTGTQLIGSVTGRQTFRIFVGSGEDLFFVSGANAAGTTFIVHSARELPGNHRYQTTSANRPVVSARVNLLTKTEQFDDAAWSKTSATITANAAVAPDGTLTADKFIPASGAIGATSGQSISVSVAQYAFSFKAKAAEQSKVSLISNLTGIFRANVFDLSAQTTLPGTGWTASISPDPADAGWFICTCAATADVAALKSFQISNNGAGWTGNGTDGVYVWGADLRPTNTGVGLPPYQRVNTSTDYDTAGFPVYIKPNGSNQFMVSNAIDFTATDKMTVWAGVRKLSDAAGGMVCELGTDWNAANGVFGLLYPRSGALNEPLWGSKGTSLSIAGIGANTSPAPRTNILTGIGSISTDVSISRVNGVQYATNGGDQGAGNYGNYSAYHYARAGTSNFFNGHDYGSICRGAASSDAQITNAESWINQRTKAY